LTCSTPCRWLTHPAGGGVLGVMNMSEWIKVSDRLPDDKGIYNVLVSGDDFVNSSTFGYFTGSDWEGQEWERVQECSGYESSSPYFSDYDMSVTHWMPLPEPPTQE